MVMVHDRSDVRLGRSTTLALQEWKNSTFDDLPPSVTYFKDDKMK